MNRVIYYLVFIIIISFKYKRLKSFQSLQKKIEKGIIAQQCCRGTYMHHRAKSFVASIVLNTRGTSLATSVYDRLIKFKKIKTQDAGIASMHPRTRRAKDCDASGAQRDARRRARLHQRPACARAVW